MKFRLFGVEVDCGCDGRRKKLVEFWNAQNDAFKTKMKGKTLSFGGYKYTFDTNGDVIAEEQVK